MTDTRDWVPLDRALERLDKEAEAQCRCQTARISNAQYRLLRALLRNIADAHGTPGLLVHRQWVMDAYQLIDSSTHISPIPHYTGDGAIDAVMLWRGWQGIRRLIAWDGNPHGPLGRAIICTFGPKRRGLIVHALEYSSLGSPVPVCTANSYSMLGRSHAVTCVECKALLVEEVLA